jgi:AraC-like DNA-binding protein
MMPGMDGYALCRALKSDPETDFIPVFLLTAKASTASKIEGLEGGADDYIPKPFDATELRLRIRNLLLARARLKVRLSSVPADPACTADFPTLPAPEPVGEPMLPAAARSPTLPPVKPSDDAFEAKVRTVLDRESQEDTFDVVALARNLGLSRTQMYPRIREAFGLTPAELIIRFRLERAAQLLPLRQGDVAEIAYAVGFKNLSHFVRCFREHYGQTPAAFGRSRRPSADSRTAGKR